MNWELQYLYLVKWEFMMANLNFHNDVAISKDGYLFVTDTEGHRIQKFSILLYPNENALIER